MVLCICTRIALTVLDFLQQLEYHRQTVCTAIAQNADARALANVFGLTKPGTGADTPEHPIWTRQFARISKISSLYIPQRFIWAQGSDRQCSAQYASSQTGRTIVKIVSKLPIASGLRIERRAIGVGLCSTRRNEHNWRDYIGSKHSAIVTL